MKKQNKQTKTGVIVLDKWPLTTTRTYNYYLLAIVRGFIAREIHSFFTQKKLHDNLAFGF